MQVTASAAQLRRQSGPHANGASAQGPRGPLARAPRPLTVRCTASQADSSVGAQPSLRDKAAVVLTGLATSAMVMTPNSAYAVDASPVATPAKQAMPDLPTSARSAEQMQAELERRNTSELKRLDSQLADNQSSVIKGLDELQKRQAENIKAFAAELEASRSAAVRSVDELQKRVAQEHAAMLKLQMELRTAKAQLDDTQKEVVKEKGLLVAARQSAENARKEAADAAAAARSAELALKGQAGLETLKTPLGIAAASGWSLAAIVALAKRRGPDAIDWSKVEGKDEILAAMEQARNDSDLLRRESESLKRELGSMQGTISQLTAQLNQERSQRDTLRETILLLESEVSNMEQRMNTAKNEAATLKKKLDEVKLPSPKRPSLNDILTGQAVPNSNGSYGSNGKSASSYSSSNGNGNGSYGTKTSLNGKYDASKALGFSGRAVRVTFTLSHELPFGVSLKLVGSHPALGAWDEGRGLPMVWNDGHVWTAEVPLPIGTAVEFKAVKVSANGGYSEWEQGSNHVLLIPDSTTSSSLNVKVEWGAGTAVLDESSKKKEQKSHGKVLATAGALSSGSKSSASKKWAGLLG